MQSTDEYLCYESRNYPSPATATAVESALPSCIFGLETCICHLHSVSCRAHGRSLLHVSGFGSLSHAGQISGVWSRNLTCSLSSAVPQARSSTSVTRRGPKFPGLRGSFCRRPRSFHQVGISARKSSPWLGAIKSSIFRVVRICHRGIKGHSGLIWLGVTKCTKANVSSAPIFSACSQTPNRSPRRDSNLCGSLGLGCLGVLHIRNCNIELGTRQEILVWHNLFA